jgi:hypothetical protein
MGGRRRDRRDLLDELEERDDSEYEEVVTRTLRKRPRYTTPEPDPLNDEEITMESILKFLQASDPGFAGLLTDYFPNSGRKSRLVHKAPTLPSPFRAGDSSQHGPEDLREAMSLAGSGFGYLFLALSDRKTENLMKGIESFAAAFTLVQAERLFDVLNLQKGASRAILGQDLPRTVAHAYAANLFRPGAGGSQLPGRPQTHPPTVQLPVPVLPMATYPYAAGYAAPLFSPAAAIPPSPAPDVSRRWRSPSPLTDSRAGSPRLPEPLSQQVTSAREVTSPRSRPRSGPSARLEPRSAQPETLPFTTRSRGRGRSRGFR